MTCISSKAIFKNFQNQFFLYLGNARLFDSYSHEKIMKKKYKIFSWI